MTISHKDYKPRNRNNNDYLSSVKLRKTGIDLKAKALDDGATHQEIAAAILGEQAAEQQQEEAAEADKAASGSSAPVAAAKAKSYKPIPFPPETPLRMNKPPPPPGPAAPGSGGTADAPPPKDVAKLIQARIKKVKESENYEPPDWAQRKEYGGGTSTWNNHARGSNAPPSRMATSASSNSSVSRSRQQSQRQQRQQQQNRQQPLPIDTGINIEEQYAISSSNHSGSTSQAGGRSVVAIEAADPKKSGKFVRGTTRKTTRVVEEGDRTTTVTVEEKDYEYRPGPILACLLLCVVGAVALTLYFTGRFEQWFAPGEVVAVEDVESIDVNATDNATAEIEPIYEGNFTYNNYTIWLEDLQGVSATSLTKNKPTRSPSETPTFAPSAGPTVSVAPSTNCWSTLKTSEKNALLGAMDTNDDTIVHSEHDDATKFAPNVAMDGDTAVIVTHDGTIAFYSFDPSAALFGFKVWTPTNRFQFNNRSPPGEESSKRRTPSVALKGNVAAVGVPYQMSGVEQGVGGVFVYERKDENSGGGGGGRWEKVVELTPNGLDDGLIDSDDRFGWDVEIGGTDEAPLIVIGAPGERDDRGAAYVFRRTNDKEDDEEDDDGGSTSTWSRVGKIESTACPPGGGVANRGIGFGNAVAVHDNLIAVTADCEFVVQLFQYDEEQNEIVDSVEDIPYISFDWGPLYDLVLDDAYLVYSTTKGRVAVYEKTKMRRMFQFLERANLHKKHVHGYPLAMDRDVLAVGSGNEYWIYPRLDDEYWIDNENAFAIVTTNHAEEEEEMEEEKEKEGSTHSLSVAVSGRNVMAGVTHPTEEVYYYGIDACTHPMPTQSPTSSPTATKSPSADPTSRPSSSPTDSSAPTPQYDYALCTRQQCRAQSNEMDARFFVGTWSTKGCWYNGNDKVFYSPGTIEEMSTTSLEFDRIRIWCPNDDDLTPLPTTPSPSSSTIVAPTTPFPTTEEEIRAACLTRGECLTTARELGLTTFHSGDFPSKGCFRKNGKAFFSPGTLAEMSAEVLNGNRERIWCTTRRQGIF
mmetsp:Transcript_31209/g.66023  ORF Transcript_31209/g.66023 Transcript_31209/m.66023 type:complete len:1031 (-) Transcript_31209:267-3359(-)